MSDDVLDSESTSLSIIRKPRIALRVVLGIVLVVGMLSGWVAMGRQKAGKQAEAIAVLQQAGARVYFDYQWNQGSPIADAVPPEAAWARRLMGDDMLNRAVAVDLRGVEQPDAVAQSLLLLPYLYHINAANTRLSDASLDVWRRMPGLKELDLQGTQVTDAGVANLASLTQLTTVSLARTPVTPAALTRLRPDCPSVGSEEMTNDEGRSTRE